MIFIEFIGGFLRYMYHNIFKSKKNYNFFEFWTSYNFNKEKAMDNMKQDHIILK